MLFVIHFRPIALTKRLCQALTMQTEIPRRRRELYFSIIDNHTDIHPITYRLYFLENHFPPHLLDTALKWLVSNDLKGKKFLRWFKEECGASDLEMHHRLLRRVNNEIPLAIIAGKNFKI